MADTKALRLPLGLRLATAAFLTMWAAVALFPLLWTAIMSFRLPVDALAGSPLTVLAGPETLARVGGLSPVAMLLGVAVFASFYMLPGLAGAAVAARLAPQGNIALGWVAAGLLYAALGAATALWLLPAAAGVLQAALAPIPVAGWLGKPLVGVTMEHYASVWIKNGFWRNFDNSMLVTFGVVSISLTVGTLAGYGLARARSSLAFWLLIAALIFRALPYSVLVAGYLPVFINSREILEPLLGDAAPTLYGQPWAVIMVLVAINQPFTIWMLRSFFQNIPPELDEAARVDGCSHFGAFWRVIMPVMWPGVITTGLFSFLLAYNDYLVTALLLDAQSQTMVPAISGFLNRDTSTTDQIEAIAAAVSITAPLFVLVMVFQKQIVAGLTLGAVKG